MRTSLIFLLYRAIQVIAVLFLALYLLTRGLRDREYLRSLSERLGSLPTRFKRTAPGAVWLHAVSVGEVLSLIRLAQALRERHPEWPIFVSCGTLAGRRAAELKLLPLVDGVFYAPLDYIFCVRRVIRHIRPTILVVLETEIWPNLYREVKRSGAGLLIINGRISKKSMPSYRKMRWFFAPVLRLPDRILAQSAQDHKHYGELGATAEMGGNLKYDFSPAPPPDDLRAFFQTRLGLIWVAASTVLEDVDEDDLVLAAFAQLREDYPDLSLVLAPRKPERFPAVAAKLKGIPHTTRSNLQSAPILLLDSVGELGSLFGFADFVFMGGTIANRGGHNILEPAIAGKPIIVGPHLENFQEISDHFMDAGAIVRINDGTELAGAAKRLLDDKALRSEIGERAKQAALAETGASQKALSALEHLYGSQLPVSVPFGPLKPALRALAWVWQQGSHRKRRRDLAVRQTLKTPVISIGGIAVGGTGKTPLVAHLLRRLSDQGVRTAVLTRGYKRESKGPLILRPGDVAAARSTGDEAQILLQLGIAAVGVGSNRHATGKALEASWSPDLFLLDDGFQHAKLARDLEIVVLDALDPLAGGAVLPEGRLRENVEALRRADIIVVSRAEGEISRGLLELLRLHAPQAAVHRCETNPIGWKLFGQPVLSSPPPGPVLAFCGLGNPASFESSLRKLGCQPAIFRTYPDHHRYSLDEVKALQQEARAAGAVAMLTTEKDTMNLPTAYEPRLQDVPIFWLAIGLKIEREEELISRILATSRRAYSA